MCWAKDIPRVQIGVRTRTSTLFSKMVDIVLPKTYFELAIARVVFRSYGTGF